MTRALVAALALALAAPALVAADGLRVSMPLAHRGARALGDEMGVMTSPSVTRDPRVLVGRCVRYSSSRVGCRVRTRDRAGAGCRFEARIRKTASGETAVWARGMRCS